MRRQSPVPMLSVGPRINAGFLLGFFRLTTRSGFGEALRWFVFSESDSVMLIGFLAG